MALTQLTKIDGRGINTTSDYRVGILTAIKFVGPFDGTGGNFAGVVTATDGVFSGNVTIGGTLTYEDVTNIDSVGIITARDGIDCNGDIDVDGHTNLDNVSVSGVTTFTGGIDANSTLEVAGVANFDSTIQLADTIEHLGDSNTKIRFPTDDNISFEAGATGEVARFLPTSAGSGGPRMGLGTNNPTGMLHIYGVNPPFRIQNSNDSANLQIGMWDASHIMLQASNRTFKFATETTNDMTFYTGGLAGSYERLRITSGGTVNIGGNYSHTGSKLQVTGNSTFTGNIDANGDIDVDGHTNLDNVSIAGVTTCGRIDTGTINVSAHYDIRFASGNWSGNTTKIQNHNNYLYIVAPSNGFQFRIGGTDLWLMDSISNDGNFWPTVDSGRDIGKSNRRIRNLYATTLYGDGSNLTGITQTTINSNADNRVITGSGTANTLNAESTLTYDSSILNVISTTQGLGLNLRNTSNEYTRIIFDAARTGSSSALGILEGKWNNGNSVCQIYLQSGDDTTNKDDGRISMVVNSASGSSKTAFRIEPDASVQLPNDSQKLQFGQHQDLSIWHGGSNGYIDNETGNLTFRTTSSNTDALRITSDGIIETGTAVGASGADGDQRLRVGRASNCNIAIRATGSTTASTGLDFGDSADDRAGRIQYMHNGNYMSFHTDGAGSGADNERLRITSGGSVNIGGDYTQTTYTMKVTGSFAATTKSFVIDHPTKENHSLRYACLEGPENSVYVRGKTSDSVIELPDYWKGLVHEDSITVNVTPIGNHKVWVEAINNNSVTIGSDGSEYFYTVFAERKDVDKLEVEVAK